MKTEILTTDFLGCPVDIEMKTARVDDKIVVTMSWRNPQVEYDPATKVLKVFPPPRMDKPIPDQDMTAMRLMGFI